MKEFIKNTLAATLGTIIGFLLLGIFGIVLILLLVISGSSIPTLRPNSILKIELNGALEERYEDSPLNDLLGEDYPTIGLEQILTSINRAAHDKNIKAIYLDAGNLSQATPAMAEEIRLALNEFKESGR